MSDELEYEIGTGSVFADLGREDADEMVARAELLRQINSIIAHRHLTGTPRSSDPAIPR